MRHVAQQHVREIDRRVAAGAADVHVLAENGELLGEIAVELEDLLEALGGVDPPVVPVVEGMLAAPRDAEVQPLGRAHHRVPQLPQFGDQRVKEGCGL